MLARCRVGPGQASPLPIYSRSHSCSYSSSSSASLSLLLFLAVRFLLPDPSLASRFMAMWRAAARQLVDRALGSSAAHVSQSSLLYLSRVLVDSSWLLRRVYQNAATFRSRFSAAGAGRANFSLLSVLPVLLFRILCSSHLSLFCFPSLVYGFFPPG